MNLTIGSVQLFAPVVEAVEHRRKVRLLVRDGDIVEGTLRGFRPRSGSAAHLRADANLASSWVHITTRGGFEVWFETLFVATQHAEGGCSFD